MGKSQEIPQQKIIKEIKPMKSNLNQHSSCERESQVDPRVGSAQRQLQLLYSAKLRETTAQTVLGPGFQFPLPYRI